MLLLKEALPPLWRENISPPRFFAGIRQSCVAILLNPAHFLFLTRLHRLERNINGLGCVSQVKFSSFAKVLFFLEPPLASEDRLLILGCGAGACVMTSALLYRLNQIQGMDLMQARTDSCKLYTTAIHHNVGIAVCFQCFPTRKRAAIQESNVRNQEANGGDDMDHSQTRARIGATSAYPDT